ncbi:MAG: hypothetical protein WAV98_01620 [Minisyncoccia bacterium]
MLFGLFSRGDIVITPEQYNYHPGETIRGTVSLKLKKPTQANKFSISLKGEKISTTWRTDSKGSSYQSQDKVTIYQFELPLDGQKEYAEAQYPFEIIIPVNVLPQTQGQSILAKASIGGVNIGGMLDSLAGTGIGIGIPNARIDWTLNATLDISGTIDMRKHVQINIG